MARQCRKFLANEKKDHDLRKWAIEGLSYLSLDADVKEELCDDQIALAALFDLCKVRSFKVNPFTLKLTLSLFGQTWTDGTLLEF